MYNTLNLEVRDSVFDPELYGPNPLAEPPSSAKPRRVHVKKSEPNPLYKVWLFLYGDDLPYVESVTYKLHPTFANPVRTVRRTLANPTCQLVIWTWGLFEVTARINTKTGKSYEIQHELTYGRQLQQHGVTSVYED